MLRAVITRVRKTLKYACWRAPCKAWRAHQSGCRCDPSAVRQSSTFSAALAVEYKSTLPKSFAIPRGHGCDAVRRMEDTGNISLLCAASYYGHRASVTRTASSTLDISSWLSFSILDRSRDLSSDRI